MSPKFPIIAYPKPNMINDKEEDIDSDITDWTTVQVKTSMTTEQQQQRTESSQYIQTHFDSSSVMYTIASWIQWQLLENSHQQQMDRIPVMDRYMNLFRPKKQSSKKKEDDSRHQRGEYSMVKPYCINQRNYPVMFKFIRKKIDTLIGIGDSVHEYLICTHGLNHLRVLCPHFCYGFGIFYAQHEPVYIMEWIRGQNFTQYMENTMYDKYDSSMGERFLQLFIQLIGALELAQERMQFTHYDLHIENVMVRPLTVPMTCLKYPFRTFTVVLENVDTICQIIDFTFSSITLGTRRLGKDSLNAFPEIGMYPFFIPGVDIIKWLSTVYITLTEEFSSITPSSLPQRILQFVRYLMDHFYHISVDEELLDFKFIASHLTNSIYYSSFELMLFLLDPTHQKSICDIFEITQYPFRIELGYHTTCSPQDDTAIDEHFQRLFQILRLSSASVPSVDQFEPPVDFVFDLKCIRNRVKAYESVSLPSLELKSLPFIQKFCNDTTKWSSYMTNVNYYLRQHRINHSLSTEIETYFRQHANTILRLYNTYLCFSNYLSFLSESFYLNESE